MAEANQAQNPKKKGSKQEVYDGLALCTPGGLKKEDLLMNSKNKIVSKKRSEQGKKQIEHLKGKKNIKLESLNPEPPELTRQEPQPLTFEPKSDSCNSNLESKLDGSREECKGSAEGTESSQSKKYPVGFPERYKTILKEENNNSNTKSGETESKSKESKPKKPRKINKKLENPVIDEILHTDRFDTGNQCAP